MNDNLKFFKTILDSFENEILVSKSNIVEDDAQAPSGSENLLEGVRHQFNRLMVMKGNKDIEIASESMNSQISEFGALLLSLRDHLQKCLYFCCSHKQKLIEKEASNMYSRVRSAIFDSMIKGNNNQSTEKKVGLVWESVDDLKKTLALNDVALISQLLLEYLVLLKDAYSEAEEFKVVSENQDDEDLEVDENFLGGSSFISGAIYERYILQMKKLIALSVSILGQAYFFMVKIQDFSKTSPKDFRWMDTLVDLSDKLSSIVDELVSSVYSIDNEDSIDANEFDLSAKQLMKQLSDFLVHLQASALFSKSQMQVSNRFKLFLEGNAVPKSVKLDGETFVKRLNSILEDL